MTITAVVLAEDNDGTNQSVYTITLGATPAANALILVALVVKDSGGDNPPRPTVAGNSLTYVFVDETPGSDSRRVFLFRAMGASPTAGDITVTFSNSQDIVHWAITEWSGVDTSGTDGSGAVVQSVNDEDTGTTTITVTLAAFGDATNNVSYISIGTLTGSGTRTQESGYTELVDDSAGAVGQATAFKIGEDTSPSYDTSVTTDHYAVAVEIKAAAAAGATDPGWFQSIGGWF